MKPIDNCAITAVAMPCYPPSYKSSLSPIHSCTYAQQWLIEVNCEECGGEVDGWIRYRSGEGCRVDGADCERTLS